MRSLQHWPCGGDSNFLNSDWFTIHTLWEAAFLEDLSTSLKEAGGEPPQRDEFEVQRRTRPDVTPKASCVFQTKLSSSHSSQFDLRGCDTE